MLATAVADSGFSARLLAWHARHGRHGLPWQQDRTPYRVWLSEIMLQQTQVATVIPYFERFVAHYPDVAALAAAVQDEVLHLWSGLGYYSRARNLHRCAQTVMERHDGEFPTDLDALMALPGIGRSTAAAILAQACEQPHAILDGNVKRVLARYHAVAGWPGESAVEKRLWQYAEEHMPRHDVCNYTQAIMDLGATLCTRSRPRCVDCPLAGDCAALAADSVARFPAARPKRVMPRRRTLFLVIENAGGEVLLERRPPHGIWGGLWCFPEMGDEDALPARLAELGLGGGEIVETLAPIAHSFTHFHLDITPLRVRADSHALAVREGQALRWHSPFDSTRIGLSAPVTRLLESLR
ncbi:MAG: A/G-specific adenine glycosylase [Proteobacteria bacterium]|nr:A/G-specific adenine glycosylase [Pseudomonadota bacterium]